MVPTSSIPYVPPILVVGIHYLSPSARGQNGAIMRLSKDYDYFKDIRGIAPRRSPTVRVLSALAQHTDCNLATLGFLADVDFDRLLTGPAVVGLAQGSMNNSWVTVQSRLNPD